MKGMHQLNLVPTKEMEAMAEQIEVQAKRLMQLEHQLQQEQRDKANLEADFQHVLDQLQHTDMSKAANIIG